MRVRNNYKSRRATKIAAHLGAEKAQAEAWARERSQSYSGFSLADSVAGPPWFSIQESFVLAHVLSGS